MNHILGHPKGRFVYAGEKRSFGDAIGNAGVRTLEPFHKPIELWFFPRVVVGKLGSISKTFDCLNFGISYKILEDWLVKCKVIYDDNRDCVYGAHCMRSELAEDGRVGIWMVIREVESATAIGYQEELVLPVQPEF